MAIKPLFLNSVFWCNQCDGMATDHDCPHSDADHISVSSAVLRQLLREGKPIPEHFSRDVVLDVLKVFFESEKK